MTTILALYDRAARHADHLSGWLLPSLARLVFSNAGKAYGGDVVSESIRFRNSLRLGFAPSQVDAMEPSYRRDEDGL